MKGESLRGRNWRLPSHVKIGESEIPELVRGFSKPVQHVFTSILKQRLGQSRIEDFVSPKMKTLLPRPADLLDMERAAARLLDAIDAGEKVGIWSDYDADGVTSGAILYRFLRMMKFGDVPVRIPDRFKEGYGPNVSGLAQMKEDGVQLVVILDAGIVAFEALAKARDVGLEVIVIDHHAAEPELPEAFAVVNPNRLDHAPGLGHLCAAGLTFLFCIAACIEAARRNPDFKRPDLNPLLGLAALGTVADVVPLRTVNRAIVSAGLVRLSRCDIPGIKALCEVAELKDDVFTSKHCGFILGPRVNAAGRIESAMLALECLTTDDPERARILAERMESLNQERKRLEAEATSQALSDSSLSSRQNRDPIIAVTTGHEGVVGISASRVKDAFDAPAIVLTKAEGGLLKGSARSVPGFDIGHAIIEARKMGLIEKGGGHGMAGGLSLTPAQLPAFRAFLSEHVAASDYARTGVLTTVDAFLRPEETIPDMIDALQLMEPFGAGNPQPRVAVEGDVSAIYDMKEKHIKLRVDADGVPVDMLVWNCVGTPFGDALGNLKGKRIQGLGSLEVNEWQGRLSMQMILDDVRIVG